MDELNKRLDSLEKKIEQQSAPRGPPGANPNFRNYYRPSTGGGPPAKKACFTPKNTWTGTFFCLAKKGRSSTPVPSEYDKFTRAGLGKQKIQFSNKASHEEFVSTLENAYPKLKEVKGAFFIHKAVGGGSGARQLSKISMGPCGYTIPYLRDSCCVSHATIYIVPIQTSLDMSETNEKKNYSSPFVECNFCKIMVELTNLEEHSRSCQKKPRMSTDELKFRLAEHPDNWYMFETSNTSSSTRSTSQSANALVPTNTSSSIREIYQSSRASVPTNTSSPMRSTSQSASALVPINTSSSMISTSQSASASVPTNTSSSMRSTSQSASASVPMKSDKWSHCDICTEIISEAPMHSDTCLCRFHEICLAEWLKNSDKCPSCGKAPIANAEKETYADLCKIWFTNFGDTVEMDLDKRADLSIRRSNVFTDSMKKIIRVMKKGLVPIKVTFIGEDSSDFGGPTRDFFTEVFDSFVGRLVTGSSRNFTFLHDLVRLKNREYEYFGYLTALALVHGCPGPRYFSKSLASYILKGECEPDVNEVPDADIKERMKTIENIQDKDEFQKEISELDSRYDWGYVKSTVKFEEKEEFMKIVARHCVISSCFEEITQFQKGLSTENFLTSIKCYSDSIWKELTYDENLISADRVKSLFKIDYNKDPALCKKEEDIHYNFVTMLEVLEDSPYEIEMLDTDSDKTTKYCVTMAILLKYFTGAKYLPLHGSSKYKLIFLHDVEEGRRCVANTCQCSIEIPVTKRYSEESTFMPNFLEDMVMNSNAFTLA